MESKSNQGAVTAQVILAWAKQVLAKIVGVKTREFMANINLLLKVLQDAGYDLSELEIEAGLSPHITIHLKTSATVKEEKLQLIIEENKQNSMVSAILRSLLQANRLRGSVTAKSLDLHDVLIELKRSPNITLQWKEKAATATAAAWGGSSADVALKASAVAAAIPR